MIRDRTLRSSIFILFLFLSSIQGCVGKSRYLAEVSKGESLTQQLQNEASQSARLQKEKEEMAQRLAAITQKAALREKEQSDLINAQAEQISLFEEQQKRMMQLRQQLDETLSWKNQEVSKLTAKLNTEAEKAASLETMLAEAEKMAEKRIRDAQEAVQARENLIGSLKKEIDEGNVKISQMNDQLSVQIVSKILFPSGSDQVTGEGKTVLKKVSDTLKEVVKNNIRIEGHTDNVPIGPELSQKFPSNWELSTSRATQVVRYLAQEDVDPKNLLAVGVAEFDPVASNDTPEGRQKNRRIEIVLTPK